jgi:choice-of-anchor B domain-containing protein
MLSAAPSMAAPPTAPAPAALAAFGRAVALVGDHAFIGEPGGRGAGGKVWVYQRVGNSWRQVTTIEAPAGAEQGFGTAVASDGTTLMVGQVVAGGMGRRPGGAAGEAPPQPAGAVFLYQRGANGAWAPSGRIHGETPGARFGSTIVVAGDNAYIGAPGANLVTVYRRGTSGWTPAGSITTTGLAEADQFGAAISVDGNRVAVGAPGREGSGAVYLFTRGTTGSFTPEGAALSSRRSSDNALFGATILLNGDHLMVGAPGANFAAVRAETAAPTAPAQRRFGPPPGVGMVATFARAASGAWVEEGILTPFDLPATASFGAAMARTGNELWIGAPAADAAAGRIYRASLNAAGQVTGMSQLMVDAKAGRGSQLAATFAVAGDQAVIGMPGDVGGLGTAVFLGRAADGEWTTRGTVFPPVTDKYAAVTGREVICGEGGKTGDFPCGNTGLLAFLPISQVGGGRGSQMSDNWGWTDPDTKREYALAGRNDGTGFVDITDPTRPRYLGNLPMTPGANAAAWRDIKVYKNHAYIVADNAGPHGMQVFDLTRLRAVTTPQEFEADAIYRRINSAHNIVINEETGYAYSVGTSGGGETCGGGLHMIDIRDPKNPIFAGCAADGVTGRRGTGYSHDAQCVTYRGPDAKYTGREICIGSNETAISIADVTDKAKPIQVSTASYPFVSYAHQGWLTDDHRYFYLDDEGDEIDAQRDTTGLNMAARGTRTMIYDLADLDDPILVKEYIGPVRSSDHNLYVKGNKLYMANYGSGLRIVDISDPVNPREVGFMDTFPEDENEPRMDGAWSTYPYFPSGTIIVTSVGEGLFMVRDRSQPIP